LIFLACFTGLHYLIPVNHLFPSIYEFVPQVILNNLASESNQTELLSKKSADTILIYSHDTIKVRNSPSAADIFAADTSSHFISKDTVNSLSDEIPYLSSSIPGFLDSLKNSKGQVRIIYYGDSQIEGDRVTSYLRNYLRNKYKLGGTGPGLFLPIIPVMYTKTAWIRSSSNWKRYNYLSYKAGEISHRNLGPFMAICRYLPDGETRPSPEKAFVRISPSNFADSASARYETLRIFYGNSRGTVNLTVSGDHKKLFSDTLKRGNGYNEINCPLYGYKNIEIEFEGKVSPEIYGMSIESNAGVIVDNIPQRGSAGLEFTMVDKENLRQAYKKLAPDLIILQYGLNIVKNIRQDYAYYQKGLFRQISLLKSILPETPILIVGVTDMALNEGDSIKSYANIPAIIDAQRVATQKANVMFWNSYDAMGGKSSIIKWAEKKPPLAQKDFIHFTYSGADTLSDLLISSLFVMHPTDMVHDKILTGRIANAPMIVIDAPQTDKEAGFFKSLINTLFSYNPDKPFLFTSPAFWIFFLLVLLGYSLVYKKLVIRNIYLFLVSLFFYYKAGGLFLFILLFVTAMDFTCGLLIYRSRTQTLRKLFVVVSIISNLCLIGYFKYAGFVTNSVNELFGTNLKVYDLLSSLSNTFLGTSFDISYIILPVGISFFTFQSLSYTIDVYRKKMEPVRNIIDFGFYVSFFPHLVAGPIVRASVFIPQIYQEFKLSKNEFSHALFMVSKGLIKKIIISNFIALNLVDRVFDAPSIYSGFENLLAIYGYGLQIYCDFSGYTDIAIGIALILGFRLPVNFNSPYKAKSISDFWKRWHISLSQWLRDYLYIPLGGNRKGKIRSYFNLMITMLIGGLWHGASVRYIIWGGLHGIGLVFNKLWSSIFKTRTKVKWIGRSIGVFITFQFVNFCWIFFRAPDMESVKVMLKQIFENFSPGSYMTVLPAYSSALMIMVVAYIIHFLPEETKESYRGFFIKIPLAAQLAIIMAMAILLFQMRTTEIMPFIYFRF
jgi:D-alanyl-lipoteichoic acid acyltransferase DltB (MBOAT superfamily)